MQQALGWLSPLTLLTCALLHCSASAGTVPCVQCLILARSSSGVLLAPMLRVQTCEYAAAVGVQLPLQPCWKAAAPAAVIMASPNCCILAVATGRVGFTSEHMDCVVAQLLELEVPIGNRTQRNTPFMCAGLHCGWPQGWLAVDRHRWMAAAASMLCTTQFLPSLLHMKGFSSHFLIRLQLSQPRML